MEHIRLADQAVVLTLVVEVLPFREAKGPVEIMVAAAQVEQLLPILTRLAALALPVS
jgi:hypothetical protein